MRISIFLACLLLSATLFSQQARTISGKILDARDGSPLSGVTIRAAGSEANTAVTSKQDGSFTITVSTNTKTLLVSYVGYADQEVPVSDNPQIRMSASEKNLNELIVVGYGRTAKRNLTGAISK